MKLQSRHSFLLPDSLLLDSPARAARQPHCPLADRQAGRHNGRHTDWCTQKVAMTVHHRYRHVHRCNVCHPGRGLEHASLSKALVSRTWREESPAPSKVARDNRQEPSKYRSHSAELATAIGRRAGPSKRHRRSDDLGERAAVAFGSKIRTLGPSKYAKQQTRSFLRSATSNAPEASHQLNRTHVKAQD